MIYRLWGQSASAISLCVQSQDECVEWSVVTCCGGDVVDRGQFRVGECSAQGALPAGFRYGCGWVALQRKEFVANRVCVDGAHRGEEMLAGAVAAAVGSPDDARLHALAHQDLNVGGVALIESPVSEGDDDLCPVGGVGTSCAWAGSEGDFGYVLWA